MRASLNFSLLFLTVDESFPFKNGTRIIVKILINAKISKTDDHGIIDNNNAAKGGPTTCPADPAAVVIPKDKDLVSGFALTMDHFHFFRCRSPDFGPP